MSVIGSWKPQDDFGVGACTVANEIFTGQAKAIIDSRIEGRSWGDIAKEHGLASPDQARKLFTKLTGITDYKMKGQALKSLTTNSIDPSLTIPKVKKPKLKKEAKGAEVNDWLKENHVDYVEIKPDFVDPLSLHDKASDIIEMHKKGTGYLQIKNTTGAAFEDIDNVVWNHLLTEYNGDVWKAYKAKPTSEKGFQAVQKMVYDQRGKGLTVDQIHQLLEMPKDVVNLIVKGTWKVPQPGSSTIYTGVSPSAGYYQQPPASVFGTTDFPLRSNQEMKDIYDNIPMSSESKAAQKSYTSSSSMINGTLRDTLYSPNSAVSPRTIKAIDSGMVPSPSSFTVTRGMDRKGFQLGYIDDVEDLVGQVMRDPAYLSTSVKQGGVFSGEIRLIIECPEGTMGRYVNSFSSYGEHSSDEQEFLMARGTRIVINSVEKIGNKYHVTGKVVV